jgi:GntR family transcriptional regulator
MFHVRPDAGEPIYTQLTRQIRQAVATGVLGRGEQLPSVRQLSADLVINPNTVVRAYRDLEADGVLEGVPGRGWFVTNNRSPRLRDAERKRRLNELIEQLWAEAVSLGYDTEQIADLVAEALSRKAKTGRRA